MENNDLKERIRRNIKQEIAISNIRKEFDMKANKNKKKIYTILSACAIFILGIGIFIGLNPLQENDTKTHNLQGKSKNELNINKFKINAMAKLDADIEILEIDKIPEKFKFINQINVPEGYKLKGNYNVYTRENKNSNKYNILHDYYFYYAKDEVSTIKIAFSDIEEPLRDYFIMDEENKISKIGDAKLNISQAKEMYIVTFNYKNVYFDIETNGITENELVVLLESIINNIK